MIDEVTAILAGGDAAEGIPPLGDERARVLVEGLKDLPSISFDLVFTPLEWTIEKLLFVQTWKPEDVDARERFTSMLHAAIAAELRSQHPEAIKTLAFLAWELSEHRALLKQSLEALRAASDFVDELMDAAAKSGDPRLLDLAARVARRFHVAEESSTDAPPDGA